MHSMELPADQFLLDLNGLEVPDAYDFSLHETMPSLGTFAAGNSFPYVDTQSASSLQIESPGSNAKETETPGKAANRGRRSKQFKQVPRRSRRNQPKVAELERMKAEVELRLHALSLENRKLRLRDQMMKELIDTIDEIEAFNIAPTADMSWHEDSLAEEHAAEVMQKYAEWEAKVQSIARDVYTLEQSGLSQDDYDACAQAISRQFGMWIRNFWPKSQQAITLLIAVMLARGKKALKVPEEQHWDAVAASLKLTPEQCERALMLKEILQSGALWPSPPSFTTDASLGGSPQAEPDRPAAPCLLPFNQPSQLTPNVFQHSSTCPPLFAHPSAAQGTNSYDFLSAFPASTAYLQEQQPQQEPHPHAALHPQCPRQQQSPPSSLPSASFLQEHTLPTPANSGSPYQSPHENRCQIATALQAAEISELVQAVENPSAIKLHLSDAMQRLALVFRTAAVVGRFTATRILTPIQALNYTIQAYPMFAMAPELLSAVARMHQDLRDAP